MNRLERTMAELFLKEKQEIIPVLKEMLNDKNRINRYENLTLERVKEVARRIGCDDYHTALYAYAFAKIFGTMPDRLLKKLITKLEGATVNG
ncbi:MAG: hypothetical protein L5655_11380 [Thermosediminibacteraceae bacterium]|nr:hypothetical protein [Thermosediminibacteraceae bacterium]